MVLTLCATSRKIKHNTQFGPAVYISASIEKEMVILTLVCLLFVHLLLFLIVLFFVFCCCFVCLFCFVLSFFFFFFFFEGEGRSVINGD